ncbi:hypothetical protein ACFSC4_03730 [Deinococcus malanensis]|uniref:hypothetical protein n=1 Tax=Deinococcus malanensis TaxID=1706855 RepID=UPI0036320757
MNEEINQGRKHQDTRLLWEQELRVREAGGVLTCRFDPPATSQASGLNGRRRITWRLNLVWPDGKISRNFPLIVSPSLGSAPVPAGPEAELHLPVIPETHKAPSTAPLAEPAALPASLATLTPLDGGLRIDFSARRHRDTARAFIVVGAAFITVTGLMLLRLGGGPELVFGLVGLGLMVTGVRLWTAPLRVEATGQRLIVRGQSPFKQVNGEWPATSVQRIVPVVSAGGADRDSHHTYSLRAEFAGGGKYTVGDGIRSRAVADMLARKIQDALGK